MTNEKRMPTLSEAIFPLAMLIIFVVVGYIILNLRIEFLLILSTMAAAFIGKRLGYRWKKLLEKD